MNIELYLLIVDQKGRTETSVTYRIMMEALTMWMDVIVLRIISTAPFMACHVLSQHGKMFILSLYGESLYVCTIGACAVVVLFARKNQTVK